MVMSDGQHSGAPGVSKRAGKLLEMGRAGGGGGAAPGEDRAFSGGEAVGNEVRAAGVRAQCPREPQLLCRSLGFSSSKGTDSAPWEYR